MVVMLDLFEVEQEDSTLIVSPVADLREFDYQRIEAGAGDLLNLLSNEKVKNVVVDFCGTDSFGSTALGFFVKVWKRIRSRGGRMVFCNLSDHEREILEVTGLGGVWPLCSSREEALQCVG
jgi:anti-anti-sigma factor